MAETETRAAESRPQEWRAVLVRRGWFYRLIRLTGPAEVSVEYNARRLGYESVRVNGRDIGPSYYWGSELVCPELTFRIPAAVGDVAARLEARATTWLGLTGFRLSIEGVVVYSEGVFDRDHLLPRPASEPAPPAEQLPVAAAPPLPPSESLPIATGVEEEIARREQ